MKKYIVIFLLILIIICSLIIGPESLIFDSFGRLNASSALIFWHARVPRTLSILLAGSSMSVAGLLMQTISQNRFAAPSTVGTIESAKLGLLFSLWWFPNVTLSQKMMMSFFSAVIFTVIFFFILSKIKVKQSWTIPLFGMIFGQLINSFASAIAYRFDLVQSMSSWQQGKFSMVQTGSFEWLWLTILVITIVIFLRKPLTIMQLGKDAAYNLGIPYELIRYFVIASVCLITAVNVMTVGILPFIGVIIPNIVRIYFSDSLEKSMPIVMLVGSLFVLICDILARVIIKPYEIPVSVLISIIGGLIFIWIILRRRGWQD